MLLVQNVSKRYALHEGPGSRLRSALGIGGEVRSFWALRDVSFEARQGEVFGIVGPNGSGKSTLLQIVSGILTPTSGRVQASGRIAALLELGAGFNPEFTGRENAVANCQLLGIEDREIPEKLRRIEEFAGLGQFLDRPVREYSSGMYVRLAFSTAIHVDPEILIIDEALAVGDAAFSSKCVRKLQDLKGEGVTMLFVSHDLGLVKQLCDRALYLHKGQVIAAGDPHEVTAKYVAFAQTPEDTVVEPAALEKEHGDRASSIVGVRLLDEYGQATGILEPGAKAVVEVEIAYHRPVAEPMAGILVRTRKGLDVFGTNTVQEGLQFGPCEAGERVTLRFAFRCQLARQEYTLTVASQYARGGSQHWVDDVLMFQVAEPRELAGFVDLSAGVELVRRERDSLATRSDSGSALPA